MFDVFVAELRCPACRAVVPESANTNMQTYIRDDDADGTALRVGTELDPDLLTTERLVRLDYTLISEPKSGGDIHILNTWSCPECDSDRWAMITIADARITSIAAVNLTLPVLERANFISEVNADLLAGSFPHDPGLSSVDVLRANLPAH
jgi:hypothetical protein